RRDLYRRTVPRAVHAEPGAWIRQPPPVGRGAARCMGLLQDVSVSGATHTGSRAVNRSAGIGACRATGCEAPGHRPCIDPVPPGTGACLPARAHTRAGPAGRGPGASPMRAGLVVVGGLVALGAAG